MTKSEIEKFAREHGGLKGALVAVLSAEGVGDIYTQPLKGAIEEIVEAVNAQMKSAWADYIGVPKYTELLILANDGAHISDDWDEVWYMVPCIC